VRTAREARHLTQAEVAEHLEWSISKVNRIENGENTISATDLRALMALLGITDKTTVEQLVQDARLARKRGWWDEPRFRAHVMPQTIQMIQYEVDATAIRTFQPTLFPGVMQTPEYAAAVLGFWSEELGAESRQARLEVRLNRGRELFGRPDGPMYLAILDESVVEREVGGPMILADQLQSVLGLLERGTVMLRIVPLAESAPISSLGAFTIFDLPAGENAIMHREVGVGAQIIENADIIRSYRARFEHVWELALTPAESVQLLKARAAELTLPDRARRRP
jgi:transcriptional regulator with XRE-family HTH domain